MSIPTQLNPLGFGKQNRENPLTITAQQSNSTVKLVCMTGLLGEPISSDYQIKSNIKGLRYRKNQNARWSIYRLNTVITLQNIGDYVQFKNTERTLSYNWNIDHVRFVMTGSVTASGNIMSMLNYSNTLSSSCFYALFKDCTSLLIAPAIKAEYSQYDCCDKMFRGCTGLTQLPEINVKNLASYCFKEMFYGCTGISSICENFLPVTTLAEGCYYAMFESCRNIETAPNLPATTIANYCYSYMFRYCVSLSSVPEELPATTLANSCYQSMFEGCTSLIEAPELLSTNLSTYCYRYMFKNCSSIEKMPKLPSTVLQESCYQEMFYGNEELMQIEVAFSNWGSNNNTKDWAKYIYKDGAFLKPELLPEEYGESRIPNNFRVLEMDKPLTLTADESNSSVKIVKIGNPTGFDLYYKKNNGDWTAYTIGDLIELNYGEFVQFKNTKEKLSTYNDTLLNFVMTGKIKASGNIQSLVNFSENAPDFCYRKLFQNCRSLIEAPSVLPAKAVGERSYGGMFSKTSVKNMPLMLAESFGPFACYYMMEECPIKYAKLLKKTVNGQKCYEAIFYNCQYLNVIDVDFTHWNTVDSNDEHRNWCYGTPTGTFIKPKTLTKTYYTNRIPSGWNVYNPLKYMLVNGTQYVDTNITPSGNFEVEVYCTGVLNFGCCTDTLQDEFRFSMNVNQIDFAFGNDLYSYSKTGIGNEKNIIRYGTDGKFYVNNELVYTSQSSVSQYYSLYAFALNSNGIPIFNAAYQSKIFRIKMWRDGILVSDIVPVDADGEHLFDRLNNICLTNEYLQQGINKRLQYLESTGTQYIDTNYIFDSVNKGSELEIKILVPSGAENSNISFGARNDSYGHNALYLIGWNLAVGDSENVTFQSAGLPASEAAILHFYDGKFSINNGAETNTNILPATSYPFGLFTFNAAGGFAYGLGAKPGTRIYYCKFFENGTLVHNFIPVLDNDGVPCMYDKVTRQLFYNQGTGNFVI